MDLIASSLPGITKSTFSGSTLESAKPIIGISNLLASVNAVVSFNKSTINIASGNLFMFAIPPIDLVNLSISLLIRNLSGFG